MSSTKITTNNRERFYRHPADDVLGDSPLIMSAYGHEWGEDEVLVATDEMRAAGWDAYYPAAVTNAGAAVIVLRYHDRDGYELDGYVAGWMVNA